MGGADTSKLILARLAPVISDCKTPQTDNIQEEDTMIGYVTVGTKDLKKSGEFYDKICGELGMGRFMENERLIAWSGPFVRRRRTAWSLGPARRRRTA